MFQVISVIVPILVYSMSPLLVSHLKGSDRGYRWILASACIIFFMSWYLPSPLIEGEDTSFTTHFVGGGLFSGVLWIYLKLSLGWRSSWWMEGLSLFALVSTLGAINELFEWFIVYIGVSSLSLTDTSWDMVANTLGALTAYIGFVVYDSWRR